MRVRKKKNGISVHAIAGTNVVLFGMDATPTARKGLLGFAIRRSDKNDPQNEEEYWLKGIKTFKENNENQSAGNQYSTLIYPIQSFLWGDYTVKPEYKYSYIIRPVYGKPKKLLYGKDISIQIKCESEDDGKHGIYFNRGAIASQYYAKKFKNKKPNKLDVNDEKTKWLSRGLLEAAIDFIRQAKNEDYSLKVAAYELTYEPILQEFKDARDRGVNVKISYEAGKETKKGQRVLTSASKNNIKSINKFGIQDICIKRINRPSIPHNKFILLEKNNSPIQVWTGSTNFSSSGFLGQTNVGHIVRDEKISQEYSKYWDELITDPERSYFKKWISKNYPLPDDEIKKESTTPFFSPRKYSKMLKWYGKEIKGAKQTVLFTAAFGVNKDLAPSFISDSNNLKFILLEKRLKEYVWSLFSQRKEIILSKGETLGKIDRGPHQYKIPGWELEKWFLDEEHYRKEGKGGHVFYVHTKILMIDPLTSDSKVFTGSANFSKSSLLSNDENMLLIRGNERVADIYLGEIMRLFNHFYFRSVANKLASNGKLDKNVGIYLKPDDSWVYKHFREQNYLSKRRELFK